MVFAVLNLDSFLVESYVNCFFINVSNEKQA